MLCHGEPDGARTFRPSNPSPASADPGPAEALAESAPPKSRAGGLHCKRYETFPHPTSSLMKTSARRVEESDVHKRHICRHRRNAISLGVVFFGVTTSALRSWSSGLRQRRVPHIGSTDRKRTTWNSSAVFRALLAAGHRSPHMR
jgi:hypothetical protein